MWRVGPLLFAIGPSAHRIRSRAWPSPNKRGDHTPTAGGNRGTPRTRRVREVSLVGGAPDETRPCRAITELGWQAWRTKRRGCATWWREINDGSERGETETDRVD